MDEGLKKRLIGATVLVSLVVIFVPMLLEKDPVVSTDMEENIIPEKPETDFSSRVMPLENEDLSQPPPTTAETLQPLPEMPSDKQESPASKPESKPAAQPTPETTQRVGLSAWVIQVGSFSKRSNAERLVKALQEKKYSSFTDQVDVKGKILHRVLVGPEVDKKRAEKMQVKLNKYLKAQKLQGKLKSYP